MCCSSTALTCLEIIPPMRHARMQDSKRHITADLLDLAISSYASVDPLWIVEFLRKKKHGNCRIFIGIAASLHRLVTSTIALLVVHWIGLDYIKPWSPPNCNARSTMQLASNARAVRVGATQKRVCNVSRPGFVPFRPAKGMWHCAEICR